MINNILSLASLYNLFQQTSDASSVLKIVVNLVRNKFYPTKNMQEQILKLAELLEQHPELNKLIVKNEQLGMLFEDMLKEYISTLYNEKREMIRNILKVIKIEYLNESVFKADRHMQIIKNISLEDVKFINEFIKTNNHLIFVKGSIGEQKTIPDTMIITKEDSRYSSIMRLQSLGLFAPLNVMGGMRYEITSEFKELLSDMNHN